MPAPRKKSHEQRLDELDSRHNDLIDEIEGLNDRIEEALKQLTGDAATSSAPASHSC